MAKPLPGGMGRLPLSPNSATYSAFADNTSSTILLMAVFSETYTVNVFFSILPFS
jgi:hypothetical protein